jgi:hypothetical protein
VKPRNEDPAVPALDGNYTHTQRVEVIDPESEKELSTVLLPPHFTYHKYPFGAVFMKPFQTYYEQEI